MAFFIELTKTEYIDFVRREVPFNTDLNNRSGACNIL